ncbi:MULTISPECIES: hypothetical protein [unclassified Micromonospora]|uniref:hypothetical protein n=1 Tax=unclassified Micromonospora TaxID=2617518 RepID=UPI002E1E92C5|nr:hypothetical protein OG990_33485 [Micromonospora sp. NBC_00858]
MAGVAGPMLRRNAFEGVRFLVGLAVGGLIAGVILAVPVYFAGSLLQQALPEWLRLVLLAAVAGWLGVSDVRDRTPHIWRQVPQRLVRTLPGGTLGVVWGIDLGLLFTTQKTVSLIWLSLAAVLLVDAGSAPLVLFCVVLVASLLVSLWSLTRYADLPEKRSRKWVVRARRVSGVTILAVALSLVATVVQT